MGKHSRPAYPRPEPDLPAAGALIAPDTQLLGYRAAVEDLVTGGSRTLGPADPAEVGAFVGERLGGRQFAAVLSQLRGGPAAAAEYLAAELGRYQPSERGAGDVWSFARIMLLSQIDTMWWGETAPFGADADVTRSAELVDLPRLKGAAGLLFQYREQPAGLAGRARDWARRQALPELRPRTAGLRFTRSRPVVVALLNELARDLAAALPSGTPRLWVTSLVRSVEHQHRLRSLGYTAVLPSSHCAGYACNVRHCERRGDLNEPVAQAQLLTPADDEQIIIAVPRGQPFREHHRRDRLIPRKQLAGETRHHPPAPAISRRARALSTLFFVLATLSAINLTTRGATTALSGAFGALEWVIGLIAIILLWSAPSRRYYDALRPPGPYPPRSPSLRERAEYERAHPRERDWPAQRH